MTGLERCRSFDNGNGVHFRIGVAGEDRRKCPPDRHPGCAQCERAAASSHKGQRRDRNLRRKVGERDADRSAV